MANVTSCEKALMVLKKTGEINNPISHLKFPRPKPVSPSTIKKPNQTKQNNNKQTDKQTNASDFLRFGVVYFALLVDARVAVTF